MGRHAIFFGAIGTLAETSEMQRQAFNKAFATTGLDWYWDQATYTRLLQSAGGVDRIAAFAADLGETVDATEVHAVKVRHFERMMSEQGLSLRPGVRKMLDLAQAKGQLVGFVSSTGSAQIVATLEALAGELRRDEFDYIGCRDRVAKSKPAPDIYLDALDRLGVAAADAIAIEDSPSSAQAAIAAGIATYVVPGAAHVNDDFPAEAIVLDRLDTAILQQSALAAE